MKERKLKFRSSSDNTTLVVDTDGKLLKLVGDVYNKIKLNIGFCYEQLEKGTLTEGMKETHLQLTESYTLDFLNAFGYEGVLKKQHDERFTEIRDLNFQNRELRKQLGEKISNEDAREKIKNMSESIKVWWNIYGFGHISEISFTDYGYVKLKLSGMITAAYRSTEDKTKEDKISYLHEIGFEITDDLEVIGDDKNMVALNNLITNKYPSADIISTTFYMGRGKNKINDIEVYIYNLDDII